MTHGPATRLPWSALPTRLVHQIEERLGSPVVEVLPQAGGFSPGSADRVLAATGRRAFVKCASRDLNAVTHALHQRERDIMLTLPRGVPVPHLIAALDDGEWIALVIEDIDGRHPDELTHPRDAATVLDALMCLPELAADRRSSLPDAADELAEQFEGWMRIRESGDLDSVPGWTLERLEMLESLASEAAEAVRGTALVHLDCRADNVLIDAGGSTWIIDWPWACVGASWLDALSYRLDVRMRTGSQIADSVSAHPIFADASARDIDAVLAGLSGGFFDKARQPAPANMPTIRAFQRREALAALGWLRERRGSQDAAD